MTKPSIAISREISLREFFKNEAHDFTPWLAKNIKVLGDELELELSDVATEVSVGNFRVDIRASSEMGMVIVENQFGRSNHKHLGQLTAYFTNHETRVAVWIVEHPKSEHAKTLFELNEKFSDCDFYLLKASMIKIGRSPGGFLLTTIIKPNTQKQTSREQRKQLMLEFWEELIKTAKQRGCFLGNIRPPARSWLSARTGKVGVRYKCWVNQQGTGVFLRIRSRISPTAFRKLRAQRSELESAGYEWLRFNAPRSASFEKYSSGGGYQSARSAWPKIIDEIIDAMLKLEDATRDIIKAL